MALGRFAPSAPDEVDTQYPRCLPLTVSSVRQQDTCSRNLTLRPIDDQCVLLVDKNTEHVYVPPSALTAGGTATDLRTLLNGEDLLSKTQALRLSTVDADGWPRAAVLSAGEVLALPNNRLRFVKPTQTCWARRAESLFRTRCVGTFSPITRTSREGSQPRKIRRLGKKYSVNWIG